MRIISISKAAVSSVNKDLIQAFNDDMPSVQEIMEFERFVHTKLASSSNDTVRSKHDKKSCEDEILNLGEPLGPRTVREVIKNQRAASVLLT